MKKVIVIQGVTASRKTDLAVYLAKKFNLKIVNADSTQVYKGFDIGTAKITEAEMQGVEHFLLSFKDYSPTAKYSVYEFQKQVRALIEKEEKPLILVGGSGYYLKAALYSLNFASYLDADDKNIDYQDKVNYLKENQVLIDFQNKRKVEQYFKSKSTETNFQNSRPLFDLLIIETELPRELQEQVFKTRIESQFQSGFLKEARNLYLSGIKDCDILGYRELNVYFQGLETFSQTKQNILKHTLDLAKKQKTWFKNQTKPNLVLNCFDQEKEEKASKLVKEFLAKWQKLYLVQLWRVRLLCIN